MKFVLAGTLSTLVCACGSVESAADAGEPAVDAAPVPLDAACVAPPSPQVFEFGGAIEEFAVPECVTAIFVEAFGAQGGSGTLPGSLGGLGARVRGTFAVTPGDPVSVLVGEKGANGIPFATINGQGGGCGGGGSFVVLDGAPVVVAGGGGGATSNDNPVVNLALPGGDALIIEDGQPGDGEGSGAGGTGGTGGTTGSNPGGFHVGTAGGGLSGDGIGASDGLEASFGTPNQPGRSFVSGGAGGIGGGQGRSGGFGGGGAAGFTGGGGGGFSGGGTGSIVGTYGGGGGGSLNAGTDPEAEAGVREGNGLVVISW